MTFTVSSYITVWEQMIIPKRIIALHPNNKPRVRNSIKDTLGKKKLAVHQGDVHQQRGAQRLVEKRRSILKTR